MPLIVTPRYLARRAELYHQLSQLLNAGIGLIEALKMQRRSPPSNSFREPLSRLLVSLEQGTTFGQALQTVGSWMPTFDSALLEAGEKSGRLPSCFTLLAQFYEDRSVLARRVISDLLYPVFLFHFAIFIGPFPQLVLSGATGPYLLKTLGILLPIYAIIFFLLLAGQGRHGESWRSLVESVAGAIPVLGRARANLALSRLAAALEALIAAGVSIVESWELAAASSGSPALRRTVARWRPRIEAGETPADLVSQSSRFPEVFSNLYNTGEVTGQLEETLQRLQALYMEEGTRQMRALSQWVPKIIYLAIVAMVTYRILSFYSGYFGQIGKVLE